MKRILVAALMTLTLTTMLSAQRGGPPNGGPFGQPPDPAAAFKAALDLTDAQAAAVQALQQTRRERAKTIMAEVDAKRQALEALLNATTPDPTGVGNAAIAMRAAEKKMEAEHTWFIAELKKLLTGAQQTTLDNLIAARSPIPGLGGPGGEMRGPRVRRPAGF